MIRIVIVCFVVAVSAVGGVITFTFFSEKDQRSMNEVGRPGSFDAAAAVSEIRLQHNDAFGGMQNSLFLWCKKGVWRG